MRWNILFEDLEHQFDQITQTQPLIKPTEEPPFEAVLCANLCAAKRDRHPRTLTLRSGRHLTLVPRAIGTDFVSGTVSTGEIDVVIPLSAVVGVNSGAPRSDPLPGVATLAQMLRLWAERRQPCVVEVVGKEHLGLFRSISHSVVGFSLWPAPQTSEVSWSLSAIDIVRTLSSAEEESIRG